MPQKKKILRKSSLEFIAIEEDNKSLIINENSTKQNKDSANIYLFISNKKQKTKLSNK